MTRLYQDMNPSDKSENRNKPIQLYVTQNEKEKIDQSNWYFKDDPNPFDNFSRQITIIVWILSGSVIVFSDLVGVTILYGIPCSFANFCALLSQFFE